MKWLTLFFLVISPAILIATESDSSWTSSPDDSILVKKAFSLWEALEMYGKPNDYIIDMKNSNKYFVSGFSIKDLRAMLDETLSRLNESDEGSIQFMMKVIKRDWEYDLPMRKRVLAK